MKYGSDVFWAGYQAKNPIIHKMVNRHYNQAKSRIAQWSPEKRSSFNASFRARRGRLASLKSISLTPKKL